MSFFKMCSQQPPDIDGNGKTTLDIAKDFLPFFFKDNEYLNEMKKKTEKKFTIKEEHGDCWPVADINRACAETKTVDITSEDGRDLILVILMQMVKGLVYDKCKRKSTVKETSKQINLNNTPKQVEAERENIRCNMEENPANGSSQINAEPNTLTAAEQQSGGDSSASTPSQTDMLEDPKKPTSESEGQNKSNSPTVYIHIPLSDLFGNQPIFTEDCRPSYKLLDYALIDHFTKIDKKHSYVILYNEIKGNAAWVYEILNRNTLAKNNVKQKQFPQKKEIKQKCGDLYDQGHLAAAANHRWCQEAYNDTFVLNNMTIMCKRLNRTIWKSLEKRCRQKACDNLNQVRNVHVYTGPLYQSNDDSNHVKYKGGHKAMPTHFFKVIIVENENGTVLEPECYEIPKEKQKNKELKNYRKTIEYIESVSGLKFTESNPNLRVMDSTKTVEWQGQDKKGDSCTAKVTVTISTPY